MTAPSRARIARLLVGDGTLSRLLLNEVRRGTDANPVTDGHVFCLLVQHGVPLDRYLGVRDLLVSHGLLARDGDKLALTKAGLQALTPERS